MEEMKRLDEAIKHYEKIIEKEYFYSPHLEDLYEWLKELRDRRKR